MLRPIHPKDEYQGAFLIKKKYYSKLMKRIIQEESHFTEFKLTRNRSTVQLNVYIVDFDSNKNMKRCISTIAKILMICECLELNQNKMVVFSGTYEKSSRIHEWLNTLFALVLERNVKVIPETSGSFGYQNRLDSFITDCEKHLPIFDKVLKSYNLELEDLKSLKHKEIEEIITLTSSRGIAKTGLSLKSTSVGIYRFDDLLPVQSRYSTITKTPENWECIFDSDFTQLAGRIACLGSDPLENNKRCVILARANRISDSPDQIDWLRCLKLFKNIPSINIANVYFTSFNAENSIKDDPVYENSGEFKDMITELTKNEFIENMLEHLDIINDKNIRDDKNDKNDKNKNKNKNKNNENKNDKSNDVNVTLKKKFAYYENKIKIETKSFIKKLKERKLKNVKIIWSTNNSHLFGCSNDDAIIDFLDAEIEKQKITKSNKNLKELNKVSDEAAFEKDLLERWTKNEISLDSKHPKLVEKKVALRKKTSRISISVERTVYNKLKDEIRGSFTALQLLDFKKHMQSEVKNWSNFEKNM